MLLSCSGILAEARSIAFTSLQQRQSISLASFWQFLHFRRSRPELFCKKSCLRPATLLKKRFWPSCFAVNFVKFLKTLFFIEHQWLLLAFAPIEISYSNTVCNKSATEAWVSLISFDGGERWSERFHFCMYFPQNDHFFHLDITVTSYFQYFFHWIKI